MLESSMAGCMQLHMQRKRWNSREPDPVMKTGFRGPLSPRSAGCETSDMRTSAPTREPATRFTCDRSMRVRAPRTAHEHRLGYNSSEHLHDASLCESRPVIFALILLPLDQEDAVTTHHAVPVPPRSHTPCHHDFMTGLGDLVSGR